jgi:hypothetical protein
MLILNLQASGRVWSKLKQSTHAIAFAGNKPATTPIMPIRDISTTGVTPVALGTHTDDDVSMDEAEVRIYFLS